MLSADEGLGSWMLRGGVIESDIDTAASWRRRPPELGARTQEKKHSLSLEKKTALSGTVLS